VNGKMFIKAGNFSIVAWRTFVNKEMTDESLQIILDIRRAGSIDLILLLIIKYDIIYLCQLYIMHNNDT
jgi:hypothetical protein